MKRLIFIFVLLLPMLVMAQRINRITNDVDVVYKTSGLRVFPNSSGDTISFKGKDGSSGNNSSIRSTVGINLHDCDSIIFLDGSSQRTAFDRVVIPFYNTDLLPYDTDDYYYDVVHNLNDTFVNIKLYSGFGYGIDFGSVDGYGGGLNVRDTLIDENTIRLVFKPIMIPIAGRWNALITK